MHDSLLATGTMCCATRCTPSRTWASFASGVSCWMAGWLRQGQGLMCLRLEVPQGRSGPGQAGQVSTVAWGWAGWLLFRGAGDLTQVTAKLALKAMAMGWLPCSISQLSHSSHGGVQQMAGRHSTVQHGAVQHNPGTVVYGPSQHRGWSELTPGRGAVRAGVAGFTKPMTARLCLQQGLA